MNVLTYFFVNKIVPGSIVSEYGGNYFSFVLVGIAISSFLGLGMHGFAGVIRNMQVTGTIETVMMSSAKLWIILVGSSIWNYIMTTLHVAVYFIFGIFLFGMLININFLAVLLTLVLTIIVFSSIGVIAAGMIMIFKRGDPLTWIFSSLSSLLGGMLFPITVMPPLLQKLAAILPITYSLRAMRLAMLQGYSIFQLLPEILILAVFALLLWPLSVLIFKYAVQKAKKDGSLVKY